MVLYKPIKNMLPGIYANFREKYITKETDR